MSTLSLRLNVEPLRTLNAGSITGSYTALGNSYAYPVRIYHLQNLTDQSVYYSWDGINNHGILAAGSFILLDVTTNKSLDQGQFIGQGWSTYITQAGSAPTTGAVYLTTFFGNPIS